MSSCLYCGGKLPIPVSESSPECVEILDGLKKEVIRLNKQIERMGEDLNKAGNESGQFVSLVKSLYSYAVDNMSSSERKHFEKLIKELTEKA